MTQGVTGTTRLLPKGDARRSAFTLVELMVVILIITLLASIALVTMGGVAEKARADRTRSQIARLHEMIMEQWESYATRRMPPLGIPNATAKQNAAHRLLALREWMRLELPDRITDVADHPGIIAAQGVSKAPTAGPALWLAYNRRATQLTGPNWDRWTTEHQNAECLYLVISRMQIGDSNGLKFFSDNEIGDVDEDGMPEILDGWGNPMRFLRWAPGYFQEPSLLPAEVADKYRRTHDPFDPTNVDGVEAFQLIPVIYSLGPDGEDNILDDSTPLVRYAATQKNSNSYPNYPYATFDLGLIGRVADVNKTTHLDNLSNIFVPTK